MPYAIFLFTDNPYAIYFKTEIFLQLVIASNISSCYKCII